MAFKKPKKEKKPGTALATMKDLENLYAEQSAAAAAAAPIAGGLPRVTFKDGMFFSGEDTLGPKITVIILAESLLKVWYEEEYDQNVQSPPSCFAVHEATPEGYTPMHAHKSSPNIQGGPNDHDCKGCELNMFGTAEKGNGKACSDRRNLFICFPDDPGLTSDQDVKYGVMTITPTGLQAYGTYLKKLDSGYHRPPWGVLTEFGGNVTAKNDYARKAAVPVGVKLIDNIVVAKKALKIHEEIIKSKDVLLRPLPTEFTAPAEKPKGKTAKKGANKNGKGRR